MLVILDELDDQLDDGLALSELIGGQHGKSLSLGSDPGPCTGRLRAGADPLPRRVRRRRHVQDGTGHAERVAAVCFRCRISPGVTPPGRASTPSGQLAGGLTAQTRPRRLPHSRQHILSSPARLSRAGVPTARAAGQQPAGARLLAPSPDSRHWPGRSRQPAGASGRVGVCWFAATAGNTGPSLPSQDQISQRLHRAAGVVRGTGVAG